MLRPTRRITIRILANRPHRQREGGWSTRSYSLFQIRQQAQAGLLRDGGFTAAEVGRYVRRLRYEIEDEIALLSHWRGEPAGPAIPVAIAPACA
jgi:hypothetical protein